MLASSVSSASLSLALAKALIAAAWSDGCIQAQERACIEDLIFYLPDLKAQDISALELLLDHPMSEAQVKRLMDDLLAKIETEQDKNLALHTLRQLIEADGRITPEEQALYNNLETALEKPKHYLSLQLRNMFQVLIDRRLFETSKTLANDDLASFIQKKIGQLKAYKACYNFREEALYHLCLAGILLARVVWADGRVLDSEIETLLQYLKKEWKVLPLEAHNIGALLLDASVKDLDLKRVCREFSKYLSPEEKGVFLNLLFEVALADGILSSSEIDEILNISAHLKLGQDQFHNAFTRYSLSI